MKQELHSAFSTEHWAREEKKKKKTAPEQGGGQQEQTGTVEETHI